MIVTITTDQESTTLTKPIRRPRMIVAMANIRYEPHTGMP